MKTRPPVSDPQDYDGDTGPYKVHIDEPRSLPRRLRFDAKITKALAREIAADVPVSARWDQIRELVDLATGDLDCWQLDRLTDWVSAIVTTNNH